MSVPQRRSARLRHAFTNVRGAGHTGLDLHNAYMRTAADQVKALAYVLPAADLEGLVTTPRYWMLHNIDPAGKASVLPWLLSLELDEKIAALEGAASSVAEEMQRVQRHRCCPRTRHERAAASRPVGEEDRLV